MRTRSVLKSFRMILCSILVLGSVSFCSFAYAALTLTANSPANTVTGQTDMIHNSSNQGGSPSGNTLNSPSGIFSYGTKLFAADEFNNRILIYNSIPTGNNANADVVIGQADTAHNSSNQGGGVSSNTLSYPSGIYSDGAKLFVADKFNSRILIYNTIPSGNNANADLVIGQADTAHNSENQGGSVSSNTLSYPSGVCSDGTKLFAADKSNNRVLIYNTVPTGNNATANVVIGQPDMSHNLSNQGGGVSGGTLNSPTGVYSDGTRLFVADYNNNRVLIYNTVPTGNNAVASTVVGQADMSHNLSNQGGAVSFNTLSGPTGVYCDGTKLFVTDEGNHRLLIYNTVPINNNANADVVIGQTDMVHGSANQGGSPSSTTLNSPYGVYSDGTKLFVSENGNHRILIYDLLAPPSGFNAVPSSSDGLTYNWTRGSLYENGFRILDASNNLKINAAFGAVSTSESQLSANTRYTRKVQAYNAGTCLTSDAVSTYTLIEASTGATCEGITTVSLTIHSANAPSNLVSENSGILFQNITAGTDSGWIKTNTWTCSPLNPGTSYNFKITTRNGDGTITSTKDAGDITTLADKAANAPTASDFIGITSKKIIANWTANANPAFTQYYCENTTAGTNSGWIAALNWESTGLVLSTGYAFRVKARISSTQESSWTSLGTAVTKGTAPLEALAAGGTNLIDGDIIGSKPIMSISVGSGSLNMSTFKLYVDDILVTDGTNGSYDTYSTSGAISTFEYIPKTALGVGTHKIKAEVEGADGTVYSGEKINLSVNPEADKSTSGISLAYPNPYDPAKGDVKITYTLATETDITIYVFDMNGNFVWKNNYMSGGNGGKAGYNEVHWSGINAFNKTLSNGLYLIRIVETGTNNVIGRIRLMMLK